MSVRRGAPCVQLPYAEARLVCSFGTPRRALCAASVRRGASTEPHTIRISTGPRPCEQAVVRLRHPAAMPNHRTDPADKLLASGLSLDRPFDYPTAHAAGL